MAYDWTKDDQAEADRLPENEEHDVQIIRIVFGNKQGPFKSSKGDARIMLILADDDGRQCATMLTLSERAGWMLRSILAAANVDRQKMTTDGVEPGDFADEEFAKANLIGRCLRIRIKAYIGAGGNLAEITPLRPRPASAQEGSGEIPF